MIKLSTLCPECEQIFITDIVPMNDCVHQFSFPNGHSFEANVLYHEFQLLFEVALNALSDNYYREAIGSFAASYERFMELFIGINMRTSGTQENIIAQGWKKVSRQSERQLGAFVFLFILEFHSMPRLLPDDLVNLRNKVIHQGYFPNREECIAYGDSVLHFIRETVALLYNSEKHNIELIRSINDRGDFSTGGPRQHYYPFAQIGTNRPPGNEPSLEQMLEAAIKQKNSNVG